MGARKVQGLGLPNEWANARTAFDTGGASPIDTDVDSSLAGNLNSIGRAVSYVTPLGKAALISNLVDKVGKQATDSVTKGLVNRNLNSADRTRAALMAYLPQLQYLQESYGDFAGSTGRTLENMRAASKMLPGGINPASSALSATQMGLQNKSREAARDATKQAAKANQIITDLENENRNTEFARDTIDSSLDTVNGIIQGAAGISAAAPALRESADPRSIANRQESTRQFNQQIADTFNKLAEANNGDLPAAAYDWRRQAMREMPSTPKPEDMVNMWRMVQGLM